MPQFEIGNFTRFKCNFSLKLAANQANFFFSRKNPLGLLVALDNGGAANGAFFWDDGDSNGIYCYLNYI